MAKNRPMSASVGASIHNMWVLLATMVAVVGCSFLVAACVAAPPEVSVDDPELVLGRDVYARNCVSCHGSDGGGGVGNKINEGAVVAAFPNIKDQIDLISNGRGTMPGYFGRLSGEEMEAVARYTREVL